MTITAPRPLWQGRSLALVGILLVAVNLRTAVGAVSPIAQLISHDLHMNAVLLGVIGAIPPLAFALGGLLAPRVARRRGLEATLLIAVIAMILGHLGRSVAPSSATFVVATGLTLLGAGFGNVLMPPLVKRYFPDLPGLATALYVTIMSVGATLPAVIAVPVAAGAGWRGSLAVWGYTAVVAAIPWVAELARRRGTVVIEGDAAEVLIGEEAEPGLAASMLRSPTAWAMTGLFAATSIGAYAIFGWFPQLLVETAGVTEAQAGLLLGLFAIMGFPTALLVPLLAGRLRSMTPLVLVGIVLFVGGYLGLLIAPEAAPVLWVILVGLGPLHFPLALVLINLRSRTQLGSVALSGFVQGIGYVIGAAGPFVVGLLRGSTNGWTVPLLFLIAVLVLDVPALFVLARPRFVEDELAESVARRALRR
ncbi:MAG: MFS transporter [Acidobacteria bacterium]|nr:MFS transporter [Acidobacteriota bacterium]